MIAQSKIRIKHEIRIAAASVSGGFTACEMEKLLSRNMGSIKSALNKMVARGEAEVVDVVRTSQYGKSNLYRLKKRVTSDEAVEVEEIVFTGPNNIFREILRKGHDEDFEDKLPAVATGAIPGSPEKVEVMRQRVERGESPNHPGDLRGGSQLGAIPRFAIKVSGVGGIREVGA